MEQIVEKSLYKFRQAFGSAIGQCYGGSPKSAYRDAFLKWIQMLKLCISNRERYFERMKCWFQYLSRKLLRFFPNTLYISIKSKVELCRNWNVFWDFLGMLGLHTEWLNWVSLILKMGACLEIIWEIKWLVLKWYTRIWFIHTSSFRTYV